MKAPFELKCSHVCEKRSKEEEVFFVNMESYFSVIAGINIVSVFVHLPYGFLVRRAK